MGLSDRLKKLFQLAETPAPTPEPAEARDLAPVAKSSQTAPVTDAPAIGLAPEFAPAYAELYDAYRRARGLLLAADHAAPDPLEREALEQASIDACTRLRRFCEAHGADPALLDTIITDVDQAWLLNDLCVAQTSLAGWFLYNSAGTPQALSQAASRSQARLQDFCVASGRDLDGLLQKVREYENEAFASLGK